jgi:hypothetical protein
VSECVGERVGEHAGECVGKLAGERVRMRAYACLCPMCRPTRQRKHLCYKLPYAAQWGK